MKSHEASRRPQEVPQMAMGCLRNPRRTQEVSGGLRGTNEAPGKSQDGKAGL